MRSDYSVRYELCPDWSLKFGHITGLSAPLRDALADREAGFCNEYGDANARYEYCSYAADVELAAGDLLGTAGGPDGTSAALDLWMYDISLAPNGLLSVDEYSDTIYTRCPLDYFTDELRNLQRRLLGGWSWQTRTVEPICGEISQDRAGTAQGNWYAEVSGPGEWDGHLALVHDNVDPTIAVIAVGGMAADFGLWSFAPVDAGSINRDSAEITADGTVFCFHRFSATPDRGRRFLVELVDHDTLLIEQQPGICADDSTFRDATTYRRQPS